MAIVLCVEVSYIYLFTRYNCFPKGSQESLFLKPAIVAKSIHQFTIDDNDCGNYVLILLVQLEMISNELLYANDLFMKYKGPDSLGIILKNCLDDILKRFPATMITSIFYLDLISG